MNQEQIDRAKALASMFGLVLPEQDYARLAELLTFVLPNQPIPPAFERLPIPSNKKGWLVG